MKKRTLNQTWTLCLRMWRSIAKNHNERRNISRQKASWAKENGFKRLEIAGNCFFCDYAGSCEECPGRLVDNSFQCENNAYNYADKPIEFYQELLRLNRIRKGKK